MEVGLPDDDAGEQRHQGIHHEPMFHVCEPSIAPGTGSCVLLGQRACSTRRCLQELAPQDVKGGYNRPGYSFGSAIGDPKFPAEQGRCAILSPVAVR